jgi:hypothetical protein
MTILDTAIAVFIGVAAKDAISQGYYEIKYRLRKKYQPNKYQFLIDRINKAEEETE